MPIRIVFLLLGLWGGRSGPFPHVGWGMEHTILCGVALIDVSSLRCSNMVAVHAAGLATHAQRECGHACWRLREGFSVNRGCSHRMPGVIEVGSDHALPAEGRMACMRFWGGSSIGGSSLKYSYRELASRRMGMDTMGNSEDWDGAGIVDSDEDEAGVTSLHLMQRALDHERRLMHEKAIVAYRRVTEVDPEQKLALTALARLLLDYRGDSASAEECLHIA